MNFFCNKYLILVLSFFQPMILNVGGEISPTFLFILFTSPFWMQQLKFRQDRLLKYFVVLFVLLILVQILWIPFAHTGLFIQLKGIMVTVSGLIYFLYFYLVTRKNRDVVKWITLGIFLSSFVFVNVLAEMEGGEFGLWKFQIMPRLVSAVVLIYLWLSEYHWMQKLAPLLFIGVGLLGVATGARSAGLVPLMAGLLVLLLRVQKNIRFVSVKKYLVIGLVVLYGIYAFIYVPNVLNGTIYGGNTGQLKKVDNPYNPINLLMIGRTDAIIPFIAFGDKPITGWGYNTSDPHLYYRTLMMRMASDDEKKQLRLGIGHYYTIPGHSVWGYYACSYGVIAFILILLFIAKVWKCVYISLRRKDKYLLYRSYLIFMFTWNILFSPMAHFKTLPMYVAIMLVLSTISYYGKSISIKKSILNMKKEGNKWYTIRRMND